MRNVPLIAAVVAWSCAAATGGTNLVANGKFERELEGWRPLWSSKAGTASVRVERGAAAGTNAARIEQQGEGNWSLEPDLRVPATGGDIFALSASLKFEGAGTVTLCASAWDAQGKNVEWHLGNRTLRQGKEWRRWQSRFVVPAGVTEIRPRLVGFGTGTVLMTDYSLVQEPGVESLRGNLAERLTVTNRFLEVSVKPAEGTIAVLDHRTGRRWEQTASRSQLVVSRGRLGKDGIELEMLDVPSGLKLAVRLKLEGDFPEFTVELSGDGSLGEPIGFPFAFSTQAGDRLIVPINEGISYPAEDPAVDPVRLVAYGGHGICMSFWGVTDGRQGHEVIIESPDDAAIQLGRRDGRLVIAPEWEPQRGSLGYPRRLRYVLFEKGGYVAMAKRYREHVRRLGRLRTLAEKRHANPNVDLLVGAVNVWNWDADPVPFVKEMQAAGIERILWSRGGSPEALRGLNELKVLSSRYDIYQDVMDPANFPSLKHIHPDWPREAWPKDLTLKADGDWLRGWGNQGKNGEWYYCGVTCDSRALDYARKRIAAELVSRPYTCRFIDVSTAMAWNECYHPDHPMTRTDSREARMKLLGYVSHEAKLVAGSETGHDGAVPYVEYFEGMLSLAPYRVPDSGRNTSRIWAEAPERVAKFQLGQRYRLPLWELVYHDCVVAHWYWGDYSNKIPSVWDKRDLFNLLYGTPPMFMLDRKLWLAQKDRFVQSYRKTCPFVRAAGYSEMTDHRLLTADRDVQQSEFANGLVFTVNFGTNSYRFPSGEVVEPRGFRVQGMPAQRR